MADPEKHRSWQCVTDFAQVYIGSYQLAAIQKPLGYQGTLSSKPLPVAPTAVCLMLLDTALVTRQCV